ncbi:MAG TPA: biotin--[acetyl-CoA-carboxylase] ligase [Ruminococcaceae bacterium]|nr:biotin--[acetyl-CoA-carboxylase] ligase [Oscillospiraceae bacterium]
MMNENADDLQKHLQPLLTGRFSAARLFCLNEVDSTNLFLKGQAPNFPEEAIALALSQTAGLGRRGRPFQTTPGEAMHLSFLLREPVIESSLPLKIGLAVQQAFTTLSGDGFLLKWPNDLLLEGKKVGGILCESIPSGVICGIGANLLLPPSFFTTHDLPHAASIKMIKGKAPSIAEAAAKIAFRIEQVLAENTEKTLLSYSAHCTTLGSQIRISEPDGSITEGVAECITPQGELVIHTPSARRVICAGDVSIRGLHGYI